MDTRLVVYLGTNLETYENPEPVFEKPFLRLPHVLPAEKRFGGGNVLVYTKRGNNFFVYVGFLKGATINRRRHGLDFAEFTPFGEHVVIWDAKSNMRKRLYNKKGFFTLAYISESAYQNVMKKAGHGDE